MTTSARNSWSLPPEDPADAAYIPSLWAVQKMALLAILSDIAGTLTVTMFLEAKPQTHRYLANAPRKRRPAVRYPVRGLF